MPLPPNTLQLNGLIEVPWAEAIPGGGFRSSARSSFAYTGGNQSTLEQLVNWSDWANGSATKQILGYPQRNPGSTPTLSRFIPAQHPLYPWLWATRILSAVGEGSPQKVDDPVFGSYTKWEFVRLTILFESLPYTVLDDSDNQNKNAGVEYGRFCEFKYNTTAEFITRPNSAFVWSETTGGGTGVTTGGALSAGVGQILTKSEIEVTWYQVPEVGLFSAKLPNGIPTNIERNPQASTGCVGTLNNGTFFGRPATTLLCLPPTFTPVIAPISPQTFGLSLNDPPRLWNVTFRLKYFNPPTFDGTARGWNSAPNPADNFWYNIKATGTTKTLYETTSFANLFQIV